MIKNNKKFTIEFVKDFAKNKNGQCLSTKYTNIDSRLEWQCEFGHVWKSSFYNIKNKKSWCPQCAGVAKLTIENMKELAKSKNGKCLSEHYINANTKLIWECEFGHQWEALYSPIKHRGIWCSECSKKKKLTIDHMHALAKKRNGKCLSCEYINNESRLKWECEYGHQWEAIPSSIKNNNTWCPKCGGSFKLTIKDMHNLAINRGGKCLSAEYKHNHSKLKWGCQYGHQWYANPSDIKIGKWCMICYGSKRRGENAVRNFFELLFNDKFPSSRPVWLQFDGKKIELDGYCESLKLAFEYQGQYHTNEKAYWYPDKSISFERRQLIDVHKRTACRANNVTLIEIAELNPTKKSIEWKERIKRILIASGIHIPSTFDSIPFGAFEFFTSKNYLKEAHAIAKLKNGFCLSKSIVFKTQIVEWQCSKGHTWSASLRQIIVSNSWCPRCAGVVKLTIDLMREVAKSKGGKCLSSIYVNLKTKLLWECELGHSWWAIPSSIYNHGTWCNVCNGNPVLTIKEMEDLAISRGGRCLSNEYYGNKKPLKWICKFGHTWEATPSSIKNNNTWCPKCGGSFKLTIEEMHNLAILENGKCLSKKYINARTKLVWQCVLGHIFEAVPAKVKYLGRWCNVCKKLNIVVTTRF